MSNNKYYETAKGWLSQNEREYLYKIAYKANTIINVGIEYGASLHCFHEGNNAANIVALDLIGGEKMQDKDRFTNVQYLNLTDADCEIDLAYTKRQNNLLLLIGGDSTKVKLSGILAEVTFIDGGHDYMCVKNDITNFATLTTQYLLFHDYSDAEMHAGVKQALDEWQPNDFAFEVQIDTLRVYKRIKDASHKHTTKYH